MSCTRLEVPGGAPRTRVFVDDDGEGMTLRDYFAALVLPAIYTAAVETWNRELCWPDDWRRGLADDAYKLAAAMQEVRAAPKFTPGEARAALARVEGSR